MTLFSSKFPLHSVSLFLFWVQVAEGGTAVEEGRWRQEEPPANSSPLKLASLPGWPWREGEGCFMVNSQEYNSYGPSVEAKTHNWYKKAIYLQHRVMSFHFPSRGTGHRKRVLTDGSPSPKVHLEPKVLPSFWKATNKAWRQSSPLQQLFLTMMTPFLTFTAIKNVKRTLLGQAKGASNLVQYLVSNRKPTSKTWNCCCVSAWVSGSSLCIGRYHLDWYWWIQDACSCQRPKEKV